MSERNELSILRNHISIEELSTPNLLTLFMEDFGQQTALLDTVF